MNVLDVPLVAIGVVLTILVFAFGVRPAPRPAAGPAAHAGGRPDRVLLTFLAAASGIMAVLLIGLRGGPSVTREVSLYGFFGYCLLVVAAMLAVRVLVLVFRPDTG